MVLAARLLTRASVLAGPRAAQARPGCQEQTDRQRGQSAGASLPRAPAGHGCRSAEPLRLLPSWPGGPVPTAPTPCTHRPPALPGLCWGSAGELPTAALLLSGEPLSRHFHSDLRVFVPALGAFPGPRGPSPSCTGGLPWPAGWMSHLHSSASSVDPRPARHSWGESEAGGASPPHPVGPHRTLVQVPATNPHHVPLPTLGDALAKGAGPRWLCTESACSLEALPRSGVEAEGAVVGASGAQFQGPVGAAEAGVQVSALWTREAAGGLDGAQVPSLGGQTWA